MEEIIKLFEEKTGLKNPTCIKIKGEGSNRKYFRLTHGDVSMIGVEGESIEENIAFVKLARHFKGKSLPVPEVFATTQDCRLYLQEDLGNESLFTLIESGRKSGNFSDKEKSLIFKTIEALPDIQFKGAEGINYNDCYPQPLFDSHSVFWDLNYFKYSFLKLTKIDFSELELEKEFEHFRDLLLSDEYHTFMYRDFQSRNVMIRDGEPYFIDFQGGRCGPFYYDIASFAWQAKANFSDELRAEIVAHYILSARKYTQIEEHDFWAKLRLFVLFRTLQVLGAYGYRGLFERKPHFLQSIPFALNNLRNLLKDKDIAKEFPYLTLLLSKVTELKQFKQSATEKPKSSLKAKVYSFSYKKGIPEDGSGNGGGYVFDCRGVHNPGKYEQYKQSTGLDKNVIEFLENDGEITTFLDHVYALADAHVARYIERGFSNIMFCFGCTGGQHRSVYSAQHVGEHIAQKFGIEVEIIHREQEIKQTLNAQASD